MDTLKEEAKTKKCETEQEAVRTSLGRVNPEHLLL